MNTDGNLAALAARQREIDAADRPQEGDPCPHCDGHLEVIPPEEDCPRGWIGCDTCGRAAE